TVSVGMVLANRCHRQNMKTSIINGSEVSRLSVAIHNLSSDNTKYSAMIVNQDSLSSFDVLGEVLIVLNHF
ncbi:hypothetical protein, partial [Citrobacter freundii]|uniref:hypothetical protein n=1 Tax=Citrobacter freundii TaxID=546 RepID=UPI001C3D7B4D